MRRALSNVIIKIADLADAASDGFDALADFAWNRSHDLDDIAHRVYPERIASFAERPNLAIDLVLDGKKLAEAVVRQGGKVGRG